MWQMMKKRCRHAMSSICLFEWYQKVKICFIIHYFFYFILFFRLFHFLPIVFVVIIPSRNGYYYLSSLEAHFYINILFCHFTHWFMLNKEFQKKEKKHYRLLKRPMVDQSVYRALLFEIIFWFSRHRKIAMIRFLLFCKQQILPIPLGVYGFYDMSVCKRWK